MEAAAAANLAAQPGVRVVVIGDPGTGKSSLVVAIATEQFPENVPKVMPHTRLPPTTSPTASPSPSSTPPPGQARSPLLHPLKIPPMSWISIED
jgi:GTPase SAR1 family protein